MSIKRTYNETDVDAAPDNGASAYSRLVDSATRAEHDLASRRVWAALNKAKRLALTGSHT